MSKAGPLSDDYVRGWSIACRFASVLSILPVAVIGILYALKIIPFRMLHGHVPTLLLLIAISVLFDMRRCSLLENQKIYRAITDQQSKTE